MRSDYVDENKHEELRVVKIYRKKGRSQIEILDNIDELDQSKLDNIKEQEKLYRNRIMNELRVLKTLDHPNIVKLYEYFEDDKNIYALFEK